MKSFITFLVFSFVFSTYSIAETCVSLGNGDWNSPSTWSCGVVPVGGDNVTILAGHTVTISSAVNVMGAAMTITVSGVLIFNSPTSRLSLPCSSVVIISPSGSIQATGAGQADQSIRICRDYVWHGTDGTLTGPLVIGVILPIELTFFEAEASGADIEFKWQTATELNNDYFTIEGSLDGVNWNSMNRINGAGTTEEVQDYSDILSNPSDFTYFRLKQTDFDGRFAYSDIVAVTLVQESMEVYPNPSNGRELNINLPSNVGGSLQVIRADGRIAYSKEFNNSQELRLNDINLTPGSYILQIQQSDQVQVDRLIVR